MDKPPKKASSYKILLHHLVFTPEDLLHQALEQLQTGRSFGSKAEPAGKSEGGVDVKQENGRFLFFHPACTIPFFHNGKAKGALGLLAIV